MESQSSVLNVSESAIVPTSDLSDLFPVQTWIVVLIAVLFCVAFALLAWACCVYCARRRQGRGRRGGHASSQVGVSVSFAASSSYFMLFSALSNVAYYIP